MSLCKYVVITRESRRSIFVLSFVDNSSVEGWQRLFTISTRRLLRGVNTLQTLGFFPIFFLSFPLPFFPLSPSLIHLGGLGSAVSSLSGSGWSLATERIFVHLEVKVKHFVVFVFFNRQNCKIFISTLKIQPYNQLR